MGVERGERVKGRGRGSKGGGEMRGMKGVRGRGGDGKEMGC